MHPAGDPGAVASATRERVKRGPDHHAETLVSRCSRRIGLGRSDRTSCAGVGEGQRCGPRCAFGRNCVGRHSIRHQCARANHGSGRQARPQAERTAATRRGGSSAGRLPPPVLPVLVHGRWTSLQLPDPRRRLLNTGRRCHRSGLCGCLRRALQRPIFSKPENGQIVAPISALPAHHRCSCAV